MKKLSRVAMATALVGALLATNSPAAAQEKTARKAGFTIPSGSVRIVLMRPSIRVGAQSTGGMFEPNADWTAQARENIEVALKAAQESLGNKIIRYEEPATAEAPVIAQYDHLFRAVADSVIEYQFFKGNRLPTKKRNDGFQWGIGPGITKLAALQGADYALFINTYDAYGSTGRKVLQVVGMFGGVAIKSGEHVGHAGLIDLHTGELVWLNADRQMGGDVRNPEGAQKRVRELLKGFPGRSPQADQ